MICALMIDLDDSPDFPGGSACALGRAISAYPLMAAKASRHLSRIYAVTEAQPVKAAAAQYGAVLIDPPAPSAERRLRELLAHGYAFIKEDLKNGKDPLEFLLLSMANAPKITKNLIEEGIESLRAKDEMDSAVSVSPHQRWLPSLALRKDENDWLSPYAPDCAEKSEPVWYPDGGIQILRPRLIEKPSGYAPWPWLGRKILALKQWGGGPIDYQWQIPALEYWLKRQGIADNPHSLEPQPKLSPAPKTERRPTGPGPN